MGHSELFFRDRSETINDSALTVWLYLATNVVGGMPDAPLWLRDLANVWKREYTQSRSAMVDPHITGLDEGQATALLEVTHKVRDQLETGPDSISRGELLSAGVGAEKAGLWTRDVPREPVLLVCSQMQQLLGQYAKD